MFKFEKKKKHTFFLKVKMKLYFIFALLLSLFALNGALPKSTNKPVAAHRQRSTIHHVKHDTKASGNHKVTDKYHSLVQRFTNIFGNQNGDVDARSSHGRPKTTVKDHRNSRTHNPRASRKP